MNSAPGPCLSQDTIARLCGRLPSAALACLAAGTLARAERDRAQQVASVASIVAGVLGEPLSVARRIAASSLDGNTQLYSEARWLARQSTAVRRRHVSQVAFDDAADLARVLAAGRRPLVVVSLHTRGYLTALLRLCQLLPADREIALIKREPPSARDRMFSGLGNRPAPLLLRSYARPGLRAGGVLLVMLDVPPTFDAGATCPVQLLGLAAQLPVGPVELALRSGALILPLHAAADGIRCDALLDAAVDRRLRTRRRAELQAQLAQATGRAIRAAPERWLLWAHLPAFLRAQDAL